MGDSNTSVNVDFKLNKTIVTLALTVAVIADRFQQAALGGLRAVRTPVHTWTGLGVPNRCEFRAQCTRQGFSSNLSGSWVGGSEEAHRQCRVGRPLSSASRSALYVCITHSFPHISIISIPLWSLFHFRA